MAESTGKDQTLLTHGFETSLQNPASKHAKTTAHVV
jgi:hypothetical protein